MDTIINTSSIFESVAQFKEAIEKMTPGELRKRGIMGRNVCGYPCESNYDSNIADSATYTIGRDT